MAKKRKPTGPRLTVSKVFDWDRAAEAWDWRIVFPRRFHVTSAQHYKSAAGARAAGRGVAKELGITIEEGAKR